MSNDNDMVTLTAWAEWSVVIGGDVTATITVPATTDKHEARRLLDKALEAELENIDLYAEQASDSIHLDGRPDYDGLDDLPEPDLSWTEPPDDQWFDFDGREVWTDGSVVLFRDGPRPSRVEPPGHRREHVVVDDAVRRTMRSMIDGARLPHPGIFHERFAPILRAGAVRCDGGALSAAVVYSDARVVGIVAPSRDEAGSDYPTVNASGVSR